MSGIAVGKPIELGVKLSKINPKSQIEKLMSDNFTGYLCVMIGGKTGIEEGLIFFNKGKIRIANYTYFHYNKTFKKKEGQEKCMNAFASPNGVLDTFSVTEEQAKLIKTLKEDEVFTDDIKVSIQASEVITNLSQFIEAEYQYRYVFDQFIEIDDLVESIQPTIEETIINDEIN